MSNHLFTSITQLVLLTFATYGVSWFTYTTFFHPLSEIPGPVLARLTEWWYVYLIARGKQGEELRRLHLRYGSIVRIGPNEVSIADPAAIGQIYGFKGEFVKTSFYEAFSSGVGENPDRFTARNEKFHKQLFKVVGNTYSQGNIQQCAAQITEVCEAFMLQMQRYAETETVFDMGEWLQRYASSVLEKVFYHRDLGHMSPDYDMRRSLQSKKHVMAILSVMAVVPLYARLMVVALAQTIPSVRAGFKAFQDVHQEAQKIVEERWKAHAHDTGDRQGLLGKLIQQVQAAGKGYGIGCQDVAREAGGALIAGSDTTGTALTSILDRLIQDTNLTSRVQEELEVAFTDAKDPVNTKIEQPKLLDACIKEAMRLHPSIGMILPRVVPRGGATICGVEFAGGVRVGVSAAVVQYDKNVFGEDADLYNPSRWLDCSIEQGRLMEKTLFHFGHGNRICGGRYLAMYEIDKLLPALLHNFDFTRVRGERTVDYDYFFYLPSNVLMTVRRRR